MIETTTSHLIRIRNVLYISYLTANDRLQTSCVYRSLLHGMIDFNLYVSRMRMRGCTVPSTKEFIVMKYSSKGDGTVVSTIHEFVGENKYPEASQSRLGKLKVLGWQLESTQEVITSCAVSVPGYTDVTGPVEGTFKRGTNDIRLIDIEVDLSSLKIPMVANFNISWICK